MSPSWRVSNFTPADRVPARSNSQAKERFLGVLDKSLSTVCPTAMWRVGPRDEGFAAFTVPPVVTLRTVGGIPLYLRSTLEIDYGDHPDFDGERKVNTFSYAHTVGRSDSLKPHFYSWEWAAVEPMYPHVHVRMKDPDYHGLGKLHIPTGRVFFEEILLFPLAEHQVAPQRDDSKAVLEESLRRVLMWSSWGSRQRPDRTS